MNRLQRIALMYVLFAYSVADLGVQETRTLWPKISVKLAKYRLRPPKGLVPTLGNPGSATVISFFLNSNFNKFSSVSHHTHIIFPLVSGWFDRTCFGPQGAVR